jgi:integrase
LINRLRQRVTPVRNKRALVIPSDQILAFGLELMAEAEGPVGGSEFARASRYRDGLMIALLAARPLRRRNFAAIEIGRHLLREGDQYVLRFEGEETKTGAAIEDLVPARLTHYLERYLSCYRPFLAGRTELWVDRRRQLNVVGMALWVSTFCSAMSQGAVYEQIRKLTRARFGRALTPHLFRDSAATSIATEDPEHVYVAKSVLGHSSLQTSEKHYIHAQSLQASRRFQAFVLALRRGGRDQSDPADINPEA